MELEGTNWKYNYQMKKQNSGDDTSNFNNEFNHGNYGYETQRGDL